MKITFEDNGARVVWDMPDLSPSQPVLDHQASGLSCGGLDIEVEAIAIATAALRAKLDNRNHFSDCEVDLLRMVMVLLNGQATSAMHSKQDVQDATMDFNKFLASKFPS